jgi:DNA-binding MarR family transcriptional regulator
MARTVPTGAEILDALSDGRRDTAVNLAHAFDAARPYLVARLSLLADRGLVERVGPAPTSDLYRITPSGRAALQSARPYATSIRVSGSSSRSREPAVDT